MKTFDIYFNDLKPEVQEELLKTFGLSSTDEMNWGTIPVATVSIEGFDKEFNHINDCVKALEACKTLKEVNDLLDSFPRKFGDWYVDVISNGDGSSACEVTNQWWDISNMELCENTYYLEVQAEDED